MIQLNKKGDSMTSANVSNIMQAQNLVTKVSKLSDEIGTSVDFSKMLVQNSDNVQKYEFKASEVATNLPDASSIFMVSTSPEYSV